MNNFRQLSFWKFYISWWTICRVGDIGGEGVQGTCSLPHTFLRSKKKKRRQRQKRKRVSKQKLLKGCHQGQNIIVLAILERLEFENFTPKFEIHFDGPDVKVKPEKTKISKSEEYSNCHEPIYQEWINERYQTFKQYVT